MSGFEAPSADVRVRFIIQALGQAIFDSVILRVHKVYFRLSVLEIAKSVLLPTWRHEQDRYAFDMLSRFTFL